MTPLSGKENFLALWAAMPEDARERARLRFLSRIIKLENGCWQFHKPTVNQPQFALSHDERTAISQAAVAAWVMFKAEPLPVVLVRCPTLRQWCLNVDHVTPREAPDCSGNGGARYSKSPDPTPEQREMLQAMNFLTYADAAELYGVTRERIRQLCSPVMQLNAKFKPGDIADLRTAIPAPAPSVRELANRLQVPTYTAARWMRTYGEQLREEQFKRLREMRAARRAAREQESA